MSKHPGQSAASEPSSPRISTLHTSIARILALLPPQAIEEIQALRNLDITLTEADNIVKDWQLVHHDQTLPSCTYTDWSGPENRNASEQMTDLAIDLADLVRDAEEYREAGRTGGMRRRLEIERELLESTVLDSRAELRHPKARGGFGGGR